ncbi:MAG: putative DNA-binding domain-containing protein [Burkholderiaceae bacterium]
MPTAFYDYVRGVSDDVPTGYELQGMKVYRYLVYLGASQMVEACFPNVKEQLSEEDWQALIEDFVRQSTWTSHFYGDLEHEFRLYLDRTIQSSD